MTIDSTRIMELLVMSIGTEKGSWFADLEFGSQLHTITKVNGQTVAVVKSMIVTATRWLVDDGLATSIEVETERSGQNQISYRVTVWRPDGGNELLEEIWRA